MPPLLSSVLSQLSKHWTSIAHHLYLKHECPVPLPRVGPLAELLSVTRSCCKDLNKLAAQGAISPADVAAALQDSKAVKTLGTLVKWLQAEPQEQLLLSTESSEALWQLLLVTLANLLRAADHNQAAVAKFKETMLASGMLAGLPSALEWLLQEYPNRCLTASAGAWLFLQELVASSSSSSSELAAASDIDSSNSSSSSSVPDVLKQSLPQLAAVLQAYVDQAYATQQQQQEQPLQPTSSGVTRASGAIKKSGKDASSGSDGTTAAAAGTGEVAGGSSRPASDAGSEDGSWFYSPPVCLSDDPSSSIYGQLLAVLHGLQARLLVAVAADVQAAAADAINNDGAPKQEPQSTEERDGSSSSSKQVVLPAKACLQVLALANTWFQEQPHDASAAAVQSGRSIPQEQLALLPAKGCALATLGALGVTSMTEALQLITASCKALQVARNSRPASGSSNTEDSVLAFKVLLQSVALLQQNSVGRVPAVLLEQLAESSKGCSKQQLQQLVTSRGQLLLQVLSSYLQQQPQPQQQRAAQSEAATEQEAKQPEQQQSKAQARVSDSSAGADSVEEQSEIDMEADERCVFCAQVLMGMCPGKLMGIIGGLGTQEEDEDDQMLGSLTEQDPARFYGIMDYLVRHVQPQNLLVLLPMAAAFLAHSTSSSGTSTSNGEGTGTDAMANGDIDSSSNSSTSNNKKSMVLLSDYAVCRSFAAALHGYSKSVVGPVAAPAEQQRQQSSAGTGHSCGDDSCTGEHEHGSGVNSVYFVLPPLRKVAEWLVAALDESIASAVEGHREGMAGSSNHSSVDQKKPQEEEAPPNPDAVVDAMKAATRTAACSLALVVLLSRAAVPVLQALEQQLQQLPKLQPPSEADQQPQPQQDAVMTSELFALDLISGLLFVRAAYQALLARMYLSQVIQRLPDRLAKIASKRSSASGSSSGQKQQDTDVLQEALLISLNSIKALLKGQGLARGWSHLVAAIPPTVVVRVREFQGRWPGDFMTSVDIMNSLKPANMTAGASGAVGSDAAAAAAAAPTPAADDCAGDPSSNASDGTGSTALFMLPCKVQREVLKLLRDLRGMFDSLLIEVPLPVGCNNPACSNLAGMAEASLGCNKRCSQCMASHYCSKACQTAHWPEHKNVCKRVKQL